MTDLTILGGGWVLKDPGSHDVLMATGTELILVTRAHPRVFVWVMAVHAGHSALGYRVVGRVAEAGPYIGMAFHAELRRCIHIGEGRAWTISKVLPGLIVGVMAIATKEPRLRVLADAPLKVTVAAGCVTAEAVSRVGIADIGHRLRVHV